MTRRQNLLVSLFIGGVALLLLIATAATVPLRNTIPFTPTAFNYLPAVLKNHQLSPPTATPTPTATATSTATPTATPTSTPTLPPPSFDGCQEDPDPGGAGNYPVRIVVVVKDANPEVVRLENVSGEVVDLTGWHVCSISGNQEHYGVGGVLASGEVGDYVYTGGNFIWSNSQQDNGALYNAAGQLVSYWIDE